PPAEEVDLLDLGVRTRETRNARPQPGRRFAVGDEVDHGLVLHRVEERDVAFERLERDDRRAPIVTRPAGDGTDHRELRRAGSNPLSPEFHDSVSTLFAGIV